MARMIMTVRLCLVLFGTVVVVAVEPDYTAIMEAMEAALQEADTALPSGPGPGLAAQPDATVAEQPWRPGDCTDYPGESLQWRFRSKNKLSAAPK